MKAISDLWNSPNTDATNSSSFSGLPGGVRGNGAEGNLGSNGYGWSSTASSSNNAWYRELRNGNGDVIVGPIPKYYGYSVRCLRD